MSCWIRKALLLAASVCAAGAAGEQHQAAGKGSAQQQNQTETTAAQRADATHEFLGLGALPDKIAAARGKPLFLQSCAFCHGPSGRGATAPSLITSDMVLADDRGEHLMPFLRKGRPEKGMPAFASLPDEQLRDIAEFLHLQVETVANRGAYHVLNIVVGNASDGKAYVEAHCSTCHSAKTFAHIASRYRSPEQLQRTWIWPVKAAEVTATVKTAEGSMTGRVMEISDFRITLANGSGQSRVFERGPGVEVRVNDPLSGHEQILKALTDNDMHNVTAFLETQK